MVVQNSNTGLKDLQTRRVATSIKHFAKTSEAENINNRFTTIKSYNSNMRIFYR